MRHRSRLPPERQDRLRCRGHRRQHLTDRLVCYSCSGYFGLDRWPAYDAELRHLPDYHPLFSDPVNQPFAAEWEIHLYAWSGVGGIVSTLPLISSWSESTNNNLV